MEDKPLLVPVDEHKRSARNPLGISEGEMRQRQSARALSELQDPWAQGDETADPTSL
jgi:hypothetical protein